MPSKSNTLTVQLTVKPSDGKSSTTQVKVQATSCQVSDVLKKAGVSAKNKDILVNGKPATPDTYLGSKDKLTLQDVKVEVAERAQAG